MQLLHGWLMEVAERSGKEGGWESDLDEPIIKKVANLGAPPMRQAFRKRQ